MNLAENKNVRDEKIIIFLVEMLRIFSLLWDNFDNKLLNAD